MKKNLFFICVFISVVACNKSTDFPSAHPMENDKQYSNLNKNLTASFSTLFNSSENFNFVTLVDKNEDYSTVKINLNKNSEQTRHILINKYFTNLNYVQKDIYFTGIFENDNSLHRINGNDLDSYLNDMNQLSEEYRNEIRYFTSNVENVEIEDLPKIISDFNNRIYASESLTDDEKIQLVAFSALTSSFSTFVKEGGLDEVRSSIILETGQDSSPENASNGRISGTCKVNWRDAFRNGVEGFLGGALRGAWVGATTGTIAVPGIGTVTGAVSGAVAMGAVGFVGGVGGSLAKQAIWNCVLSTTAVDAGCQYYFDRARNNTISIQDIPSNCLGEIKIELTD